MQVSTNVPFFSILFIYNGFNKRLLFSLKTTLLLVLFSIYSTTHPPGKSLCVNIGSLIICYILIFYSSALEPCLVVSVLSVFVYLFKSVFG